MCILYRLVLKMALIHPLSAPAAPACLELFSLPETQTAVVKRYSYDLPPISSLEGISVDFQMRPNSDEYNNIREVKICGSVRVVHEDGTTVPAAELAVPINLYAHTLWKQCDVKFGNQILSHPQHMYGYKAMIKTLLIKGWESKETQLAAEGYYKDTAGSMDATAVSDNKGLLKRTELFSESKYVDFEGRLLEDCLELDRYLLNNIPISIKLVPAAKEFVIMASDTSKKYKLEFKNLKLKFNMIKVSPGVILGHAEALTKSNALYPFIRVEMMNHSVAQGESNVNLYNICTKSVPSRLVLGMVTAKAFNGNVSYNPFNFQHFNVGDISLVVNETIIGGQPLTVDFDDNTGRSYVNAYNQMFSTTGTEGMYFGNNIRLEEYAKVYSLFCFNLEPFEKPGQYYNLIQTGYVRLSIQFKKALTETIVLIIYTEHLDMFQVDGAKNVLLT